MKYVVITGGVTSSLGKGVVAASIGNLLKARGFKVILQKFDPYLNIDPGTLSPFQHGEVFVTEDGAETDLDLGHYERFTDISLTRESNVTTGKIYQTILENERKGIYLGSTVQVIPHVTDEIKRRLYKDDSQGDITITEIGGTVGDIEGLPFLEAVRQIRQDIGQDNVVYVHVTLVPTVIKEVKTKPTQHSVKELRSIGIQPDILICRTEKYGSLTDNDKKKIAMFCNVRPEDVIENHNLETIYELPKILHEAKLDELLIRKLNLPDKGFYYGDWDNIGYQMRTLLPTNKMIGIVGKYTALPDAYISIVEAVKHACLAIGQKVEIDMVDAEDLEEYFPAKDVLEHLDGIIVPGGFGERGIEGKISAVKWARQSNTPCFGICLGMQAMLIEAVRNQGLDANSLEFDINTPNPVITLMDEQRQVTDKGGTMRLGNYLCHLTPHTRIREIYGTPDINERHRHRYEFNRKYTDIILKDGLYVVGTTPDCKLAEVVTRPDHLWFVGCQYHPEFKSRPRKPHPLFLDFIKTVIAQEN